MDLPKPTNHATADDFVDAVESLGRSVGARPLGPCCIGLLAAHGLEADFWWSIFELLKDMDHASDDTIADVLRKYWERCAFAGQLIHRKEPQHADCID